MKNGAAGLRPARWAARESQSRGRLHPEPAHPYRGEYQRDRDRIVHSSGFRRLVYKTQVFVNHEGDLYRTRLTHSLEVAQIGRTVARCLDLNGELVEAIALAHDLGHTPFGHAGEDALHECMKPWGGFEHNLQSLRVVDELEQRYMGFPGLNLTFETREGILKHCSKRNARRLGELGQRFLTRGQPGLEAQVANLADEIAYNNHDVDDGLRSGLLSEAALCSVPLFRRHYERVVREAGSVPRRVLIHETIRAMINEVVTDLVETSRRNIRVRRLHSSDDVRALTKPLIALSPATLAEHLALKRYLRRHLYRHEQVIDVTSRAQEMLKAVFQRFLADVRTMPREHANRARAWEAEKGEAGRARAVADYVAGMTDRYAFSAYKRLVDPRARLP
ncbi:MAG: deoxyguanosinetriphosphate triphosphohydrolase [Chromatiales bacterium]|nr:deoxyguanosinetriphosphate triphosphohydrolase [Chromatiales bacterium]